MFSIDDLRENSFICDNIVIGLIDEKLVVIEGMTAYIFEKDRLNEILENGIWGEGPYEHISKDKKITLYDLCGREVM